MLVADALQLAIRAITAQRLRSFLTLLGIAVGIAAVILLTSIGEGIHRFVLSEFTQFGTNLLMIEPGKVKTSGPNPTGIPTSVRPLTLDDAPRGTALLAIDSVGAGVGEKVLVVIEGRAAGAALRRKAAPVDAAIIGIVDRVAIDDPARS